MQWQLEGQGEKRMEQQTETQTKAVCWFHPAWVSGDGPTTKKEVPTPNPYTHKPTPTPTRRPSRLPPPNQTKPPPTCRAMTDS